MFFFCHLTYTEGGRFLSGLHEVIFTYCYCWSEEHILENVGRYEYYWCDGVNYKKPTKLSATQYIELLMEWIEVQINNEELFPQTTGMIHEVMCTTLCGLLVFWLFVVSILNAYVPDT